MELSSSIEAVREAVWGPAMVALLLGCGIYLSIRTGFVQLTRFRAWWRGTILSLFRDKRVRQGQGKQSLSQFQALTTALAATVGTGNIAGVATAILTGGPGAVFWMWISAFFGMCTKYAEALLAVRYRYRDKAGNWMGGAMVYLGRGVRGPLGKGLAVAFCLFAALAAFGIGNMTQVNAIAGAFRYLAPGLPTWGVGLAVMALAAPVLLGGIRRIGAVTERLVPLMSILYILGGLGVILFYGENLGRAFRQIFQGAFSLKAAGGGLAGTAMARALRYGVARGVFSNEAGLGSASMAHAAADVENPVQQGYWGIFEVFADTIVVCTITALVLLTAFDGEQLGSLGLQGAQLSIAAFGAVYGPGGEVLLALSLCLFAFSTVIGWSYYGNRAITFLLGPGASRPYTFVYILAILGGCTGSLELVWNVADILNGLMAIPNVIGLLLLSGEVARLTRRPCAAGNSGRRGSLLQKRRA